MSPSPPKHRKLITQARDKSMRPSTSGWSKLTSRKYVCCQMLQVSLSFPPLPLSGTSCNVQYIYIDVQYIDVQYSGSPQRETWSKSRHLSVRFFLVSQRTCTIFFCMHVYTFFSFLFLHFLV